MPAKVRTLPKRTATSNGPRPTIRQVVELAIQLPENQLPSLRKQLEALHIARWRRDRDVVAKEIEARGITEQSIDEYIQRHRRESRR